MPLWGFLPFSLMLCWILTANTLSPLADSLYIESAFKHASHWSPQSLWPEIGNHDSNTPPDCHMVSQCWSDSLQAEEWIHVNETECYCPGTDQWTTLTLSRFDCCQFSITVHQSRLYITGGGSLRHMSKEDGIFVYEPEGRIWKKAGSLPNPLVDHASCMITLSHETIANQQERGEECSPSCRRKKSTLNLFITNKQEPQSVS